MQKKNSCKTNRRAKKRKLEIAKKKSEQTPLQTINTGNLKRKTQTREKKTAEKTQKKYKEKN